MKRKKRIDTLTVHQRLYRIYLQSPIWKKHRALVLARDNYECVACGINSRENEVHHERYDNIATIKEVDDCVTMCPNHHKGTHNTLKYLAKLK